MPSAGALPVRSLPSRTGASTDAPSQPQRDRLTRLPPELIARIFAFAGPGAHLYCSKRLVPLAREAMFGNVDCGDAHHLGPLAEALHERPVPHLVKKLRIRQVTPPAEVDEYPGLLKRTHEFNFAALVELPRFLFSRLSHLRHLVLEDCTLAPLFLLQLSPATTLPCITIIEVSLLHLFLTERLPYSLRSFPSLKHVQLGVDTRALYFGGEYAISPTAARVCHAWRSNVVVPDSTPLPVESLDVRLDGPEDCQVDGMDIVAASFTNLKEVSVFGTSAHVALLSVLVPLPIENLDALALRYNRKAQPDLRVLDQDDTVNPQAPRSSLFVGVLRRAKRLERFHLDFHLDERIWTHDIPSLPSLRLLDISPFSWPCLELLESVLFADRPASWESPSLIFAFHHTHRRALRSRPPPTRLPADVYAQGRRYLAIADTPDPMRRDYGFLPPTISLRDEGFAVPTFSGELTPAFLRRFLADVEAYEKRQEEEDPEGKRRRLVVRTEGMKAMLEAHEKIEAAVKRYGQEHGVADEVEA
ncbi:hypothetical protein JCM8097_005175 [Rhodosporidiobolus ruineniae]